MSRYNPYTVTLDDDRTMSKVIEAATGMPTRSFTSSRELMAAAPSLDPVAAFVDVHVGTESGLEVVPKLRDKWFYRPLLVMTADPSDLVVMHALASGADDFLMKPVRAAELLARLQARLEDLRRREEKNSTRLGDVILDSSFRAVKGRFETRHVSETVLKLLRCLATAEGSLVAKDVLKLHGWGDVTVTDAALDRKLHELRTVLQETSRVLQITNVHGQGYLLEISPGGERGESESKQEAVALPSEFFDDKKVQALRELEEKGTPDFLGELASIFLADAPPLFQAIREAANGNAPASLKKHAHKLKGMCLNIGARTLATACSELEKLGTAGSMAGADRFLTQWQTDFPEVQRYLHRLQR